MNPSVNIIAAVAKNGVIGNKGEMPWILPNDLKMFKRLTLSHPAIQGRKTYESILNRHGSPLEGRLNIVVTRQSNYKSKGNSVVAKSFEEAIKIASNKDGEKVFVIGGTEIYKEALRIADRVYITQVDKKYDGDTYFPQYEKFILRSVRPMPRDKDGIWLPREKPLIPDKYNNGWQLLSDSGPLLDEKRNIPYRFLMYQRAVPIRVPLESAK